MPTEIITDVAILGAGSAGLYALREVRRANRSFVLIDPGPLGTTCARVGCMPSKVALHSASQWAGRRELSAIGGSGAENMNLDRARTWAALRVQRDGFSDGAASKARTGAGEFLMNGSARFLEPTVIEVTEAGNTRIVRAKAVVIATGSRPIKPAWLEPVAHRVITTDELFELETLPETIGVLGLGAIGLEMGLALSRLGIKVIGADIAKTVAGISDPQVSERALKHFSAEMTLWLGEATRLSAVGNQVRMQTSTQEATVDLILAALGRRPNTDTLNLAAAGFALDAKGAPVFDPTTLQVEHWPVFIAGDVNAYRPLMHEAADEGAMAGFNAARGVLTRFRRKVPLAIAFTAPDIAVVGARYDELDPRQTLVGSVSGEANGRAQILGAEDGLVRIYADAGTGRLLGASICAVDGEHLAHQLAWAIQRGETAQSLLEMPFYHPALEELLQSALQEIGRNFWDKKNDIPLGLVPEIRWDRD